MSKKFSIVTVTYNSGKTVEQTIKSVLLQSYSNFEYIIIDGASTDNTLEIVKKYAELDKRIRYISEPDKGIYDAMNKGIEMATGDAVALLNSDDYYESDALEKIADYMPENGKYVIYGMIRIIDEEKEDRIMLSSHHSLPKRMMMHPACFVSKAVYEQYLYDVSYKSAADYELFLRLYQDKEIEFIPVYEIATNFRTGGMSSSFTSLLETNDILYKYGHINRKTYLIRNTIINIKKWIMK